MDLQRTAGWDLTEGKYGNTLQFPREGEVLGLLADKSGHLTIIFIKS